MKYSFPVGDLFVWVKESKLAFLFKLALVQKLYLGWLGVFLKFFSWCKVSAFLLLFLLATCRIIYISEIQKNLKFPYRCFGLLCFNINKYDIRVGLVLVLLCKDWNV